MKCTDAFFVIAISSVAHAASAAALPLLLHANAETSHAIDIQFEESTPVDHMNPGRYVSRNGYFGVINLSLWADEYKLNTCLRYGDQCFPATLNAVRTQGNQFHAQGKMFVEYQQNITCEYAVTAEIKAYDAQLFIKSNHPDFVYDGIVNGICPGLPRSDNVHQEPYVLRQ